MAGLTQEQTQKSTDSRSSGSTVITTTTASDAPILGIDNASPVVYKLYKRRWFGFIQLILLNIVISWSWLTFASVSTTAAQYFQTSESAINWLSTAFLFCYVIATPVVMYTIHHRGPKTSITASASLLLVGTWIRYGGAQSGRFGVVMFGQLLIGLAQPFSLSLPTTYSQVWFSAAGRTTVTAVTSLSNPLGAALGQLAAPFWAGSPSKIPDAVLYISIIATVASLPSFFIPARPPTAPSPATREDTEAPPPPLLPAQLRKLAASPEFYLIVLPFASYVGLFNAFSSLINQFLYPYGFTEDDAGIAGALLIFVGIGAAAVASPLVDRYKFHLAFIKLCIPVVALMYLAFYWAPPSHSAAFVYAVCAVIGASSFGLVPVALELLVETHYPLGPETGSSLAWASGQLLAGIYIIVMDALRDTNGDPANNMQRALVFQAVIACVSLPLPLALGLFGRKEHVRMKRWEVERQRAGSHPSDVEGS